MRTVTGWLILLNVAAFVAQKYAGDALLAQFALWPIGRFDIPGLSDPVGFRSWQLVSSAFLHASISHIALNMLALYMFGRDVERTLGGPRYFVLYFAAVISAALVQLFVVSFLSRHQVYPTLGASGGVFGILLAFGVLFPRRLVFLLFPPIPLPARVFVVLYGLIELANGVLGTEAGVAHFAHLGGMLGAWICLSRWRRRRRQRPQTYA
jgi:membrane associated rhomboid family serine protease